MKTRALTGALLIIWFAPMAGATPQKSGNYLAQKLVNDAHTRHPEASEIGIATIGSSGCKTIASTDKNDIGEKCEAEDFEPIHTGKSHVRKEGKDFDVTLALHDQSGKIVGSVGIELAPQSGQTQADVLKQAEGIAKEMEQAIPSKVSLTQQF